MLIKINNKPIEVKEESEDKEFSWVYLTVSLTGYFFILYLLDFMCFVFMGYHMLPLISTVGDFICSVLKIG